MQQKCLTYKKNCMNCLEEIESLNDSFVWCRYKLFNYNINTNFFALYKFSKNFGTINLNILSIHKYTDIFTGGNSRML